MNHKTIDTSLQHGRSDVYYAEIRAYFTGDGVFRHRFRAYINRNFYDDQSVANIEKWSDDRGWLLIASHPIHDFPCASIKVTQPLTDGSMDLLSKSAEQLFQIGERFINF